MAKSKEEQGIVPAGSNAMTQIDSALMAQIGDAIGEDPSQLIKVRESLLKANRLKLTNAMSKAFKSRLAEEGDFVIETREQNFGKEVTIIPIMISESASLLDKQTSNVVCSSNNLITNTHGEPCKQCPYNEYWNDWGTAEAKKTPGCKTSIDVLCIPVFGGEPQAGQVVEMNFRKNNTKAGKSIINLMANDPRKIPFASKYTLKSFLKTQEQYTFYAIHEDVKRTPVSNEDLAKILPTVKRVIDAEKKGEIEREVESDALPI